MNGGDLAFSGLLVYDVNLEQGFTRLGGIDHGTRGVDCNTWWSNANSAVKRSVFLDDLVYSIAADRLKVQRIEPLRRGRRRPRAHAVAPPPSRSCRHAGWAISSGWVFRGPSHRRPTPVTLHAHAIGLPPAISAFAIGCAASPGPARGEAIAGSPTKAAAGKEATASPPRSKAGTKARSGADAGAAVKAPFEGGQVWVGTYTCAQGLTDLALRVVRVEGAWSTPCSRSSIVPRERAALPHARGTVRRAELALQAGAWIEQPSTTSPSASMDTWPGREF